MPPGHSAGSDRRSPSSPCAPASAPSRTPGRVRRTNPRCRPWFADPPRARSGAEPPRPCVASRSPSARSARSSAASGRWSKMATAITAPSQMASNTRQSRGSSSMCHCGFDVAIDRDWDLVHSPSRGLAVHRLVEKPATPAARHGTVLTRRSRGRRARTLGRPARQVAVASRRSSSVRAPSPRVRAPRGCDCRGPECVTGRRFSRVGCARHSRRASPRTTGAPD
jgi:hypothetical protein